MGIEDLPKIVLVQMEVVAGLPDRNVAKMISYIGRARDDEAEVVVFSELCVSGYILGDLWEVDALVEDFATYSDEICAASDGLTVLFGNVAVDKSTIGEDGRMRKYNAVYVCHNRRFVDRPHLTPGLPTGVQPKTLHPNYRFFDDDRHFYSVRKLANENSKNVDAWMVPFEIPRANGQMFRFGVQLCEDIWCQDYSADGEVLDTLKIYYDKGAQALFNLSSSPWTWKKNDKRNRVVSEVLSRSPIPFFYVNQVGAQNNGKNVLVFDGDTTVYEGDGTVVCRASPWREELIPVAKAPSPVSQSEIEEIYCGILTGLHHLDQIRGGGQYLVAVSGGVDSSTVAALLVQAYGPERVHAVNMPSKFNASVTQENARLLCADLNVEYLSFPIHELYEGLAASIRKGEFPNCTGEYTRLVDENLQARIRGADVLSGLAAKFGFVYTNNGNKTETALGYATLYGDVNGAIAPIADLYKTQVYELARFLNQEVFSKDLIPSNLLDGTIGPSAELSEQQDVTAGKGDPIKYGYHDAVLRQMIEYRKHVLDLVEWFVQGQLFERLEWNDIDQFRSYFENVEAWIDDLEEVAELLQANYFKRIQAPPIIVLSKRAFGYDLRESQLPQYVPKRYAALREKALTLTLP